MRDVFTSVATLLVVIVLLASAALAEKRVALVIGNSKYKSISRLANPVNDAADIAASLERLGFEVTTEKDLNSQQMRQSLRDFSRDANGADMAVVYFAGHGIEISKQNYLIPVDAQLRTDLDVYYEAVSLDLVMASVTGAKGLRLVLLDACRDNPFAASMKFTSPNRSVGRGLSRVEPAHGTLVSYAAKEGTTADDGKGRNSPYTKALLAYLEQPGLEVQFMFRKVRDAVLQSTNYRQEPFTYGSLPGKRIFLKPSQQEPSVALPSVDETAIDLAYWNAIKDSEDPSLVSSYLEKFPNGRFAVLAGAKMLEIEAAEMADHPNNQMVPKPEAQKPSQTNQQLANLQPSNKIKQLDQNKKTKLQTNRNFVVQLQRHLERLGCNPGKVDGVWGKNSQQAMVDFGRYANLRLADLQPSQEALKLLANRKSRVCPLVCGPRYVEKANRCVVKTCTEGKRLSAAGVCTTVQRQSIVTVKPTDKKKRIGIDQKSIKENRCGWCISPGDGYNGIIHACGALYEKLSTRGRC